MKLIIHAGMNKAGSTAIQIALNKTDSAEFSCVDWETPNSSALYVLLFANSDQSENYHVFRKRGWKKDQIESQKILWSEKIAAQLKNSETDTVIFSGEDISQPQNGIGGLTRMKNFFQPYFSEIRVIAYVRPPYSYINSEFQERVKSGGIDYIDVDSLWPHYRSRFEQLDKAFGKENVELVKFSRESLEEGDVISDFTNRVGLSPLVKTLSGKNESLSLEALAILFLQRKFGRGLDIGFARAAEANINFTASLLGFGSEKFSFSDELLNRVVEKRSDDVRWIEDRIGQSILDEPINVSHPIRAVDDLVDVAMQNFNQFLEYFSQTAFDQKSDPRYVLGKILDCMYDFSHLKVKSSFSKNPP